MEDGATIVIPGEALLLAGGLGTRLRPVIADKPKCLAEVAGRPFLEWLILRARAQGIRRFILCTGYLGNLVEEHFQRGKKLQVEIEYSCETTPLGTGGAVRLSLGLIRGGTVLVLNGDSYCRFDVRRLSETHERAAAAATLWLVRVDNCGRYGRVVVDSDLSVRAFQEKSPGAGAGLVNAGVYLLRRELIAAIPPERPVSLERDVFPRHIPEGLSAVPDEGPFIDIGTTESFQGASDFMEAEKRLF